ncbi:hypothetical protein B296_00005929 [Ensete ventricosum]|uniref:Uncharacterized protein n=1 Tax=Ensete ventricosum TaxID=4639 RepID=A0A427B5Q5_ENSVE|nr:hypothetical protein B296_00005929 [Ensete ventricosum]
MGQVGAQEREPEEDDGVLHELVAQPHEVSKVCRSTSPLRRQESSLGCVDGLQEHGLGQSKGDQVRDGDDAHHEHLAPIQAGHRLAAVPGGGGGDPGDEVPGVVHQYHGDDGVPEGRAHLGAHAPAGEAADAGAAGGSGLLRRLHPLVPAGPAGHVERVRLRPHRIPAMAQLTTMGVARVGIPTFFLLTFYSYRHSFHPPRPDIDRFFSCFVWIFVYLSTRVGTT